MIGQVAFRMIFGMALFWCLSPRREITSGFFRIQMLLTLALSALAAMTYFNGGGGEERITFLTPSSLCLVGIGIAIVAYADSILWMLERRQGASRGLWLLLALSLAAVVGSSSALLSPGGASRWLRLFGELASGWLTGGTLTAMLLGHWYLTATGMKLNPLIELNRWAGIAAATRGVLAAIGLATLGVDQLNSTDWAWLTLRWAGILGPLVMSVLVIRILRYRNTQSATGVLYASTILVFMGETAALLLARSREFGWGL